MSRAGWIHRVGADTDVGRQRQRNEDAFCLLFESDGLPPGIEAVLAVADGMGGHEAGDVASAYVVDAIREVFRTSEPMGRGPELALALAAFLRQTNVGLHAAALDRGAARGMGSTATMAVIQGGALVVAHVGDSRLYRLRAGRLEQITEDHSWTAEQRRRGLLSEAEEAQHPRRNLLTECIGVDREINVFTAVLPLAAGDRFLICSDGLHGPVAEEEIASTLGSEDPERAAELLVERANRAGGPDNVTAVVLDIVARRGVSDGAPGSPPGDAEAESAGTACPGSGPDEGDPASDRIPTRPPEPSPFPAPAPGAGTGGSRDPVRGQGRAEGGPPAPRGGWPALALVIAVVALGSWGVWKRPWSRESGHPEGTRNDGAPASRAPGTGAAATRDPASLGDPEPAATGASAPDSASGDSARATGAGFPGH
jgi:protein phosphatase